MLNNDFTILAFPSYIISFKLTDQLNQVSTVLSYYGTVHVLIQGGTVPVVDKNYYKIEPVSQDSTTTGPTSSIIKID